MIKNAKKRNNEESYAEIKGNNKQDKQNMRNRRKAESGESYA